MKIEADNRDEVFITSSTRMATMLLFCGHTLRRPPCTRQIRKDGRTIVTFLFNPASEQSLETCNKLAARWVEIEQNDSGDQTEADLRKRLIYAAELSRSKDVVAQCYANAVWRDVALSIVKATPRVVEVGGPSGATGFFHENASPEEIKKMTKYL
jgi:hypothetical protein